MLFAIRCRDNVRIKEDLDLAQWELGSLFERVSPRVPAGSAWKWVSDYLNGEHLVALKSSFADPEATYYWCELPRIPLVQLFHRLTYAQQVVVYAEGEEANTLKVAHNQLSWSRLYEIGNGTLFYFVPMFCLFELASLLNDRNGKRDPTQLLDGFLGELLDEGHRSQHVRDVTRKRSSTYLAHGLHIYKAKFFPRVVRTVINGLIVELAGSTLLDPFVGSGTAQVEALGLGMNSLGLDIDPLCVEMTRLKLVIAGSDQRGMANFLESFQQSWLNGRGAQAYLGIESDAAAAELIIPQFLSGRLPGDFAEEVATQGTLILRAIDSVEASVTERAILRIALSDALSRKVRFRFHGLGHGRFALELSKRPLLDLYRSQLRSIGSTIRTYAYLRDNVPFPPAAHATVTRGDATAMAVEAESVDVIVTSPPYIPASSGRENYAKTRALSFLALGMSSEEEIEELNRSLVGSMRSGQLEEGIHLPRRVGDFVSWLAQDRERHPKALPTKAYFAALRRALLGCRRVLKADGYCVFIVAKSNTFYTYKTREITYAFDNEAAVRELGEMCGFRTHKILRSKLDKLNPVARPRSRDDYYESILIFQK